MSIDVVRVKKCGRDDNDSLIPNHPVAERELTGI